jgi:glycosyltransferase involved in cell wall biosynthesis
MIIVTQFQRKPEVRGFSIERLFNSIRQAMPCDIKCDIIIPKYLSRGVLRRIFNILYAFAKRGQINHITGDIHYIAFALPANSTILTIHDCGNLMRASGLRRFVLYYLWFKWPIAYCNYVVAISESTRADLISIVGVKPNKIRVIHDCIGSEFRPVTAEFCSINPRILIIGTSVNKNLERMAEALNGCKCTVELVGNPTQSQIEVFKKYNVNLTVLGSISSDGILSAYARCDLLLFASTSEGFGLPILEAQATGRPVVTSNCSSMPEVAGLGACFVNPYDIKSIREGVDKVISNVNYRKSLIAHGFENVAKYTPEYIASQYADLYREIAIIRKN